MDTVGDSFMERAAARLRSQDMRTFAVAIVAFAELALTGFSPFPSTPPFLPVSPGSAVIMLTGSTNTTGYRIVVSRGGAAEYVSAAGRGRGTVPAQVARKFFSDLQTAGPLAGLPEGRCMKSASFGTSYFVYWNHSRSPDLSCTSGKGTTIAAGAQAVASALGVQGQMMRAIVRPPLPGEHHIAVPVATPT